MAALLAAGVVLTLVVRSHGGDSGPELRALQEDPLGRYVPPGGRLVRTDASPQNSGGVLSKATPATYRRLFAVADGDAAMQATIDAATAAGWTVEKPVAGLGTTGHKQLAGGSETMSVSVISDAAAIPGDTPPPVLSIALEHSR